MDVAVGAGSGVGGGSDTTSDVPIVYGKALRGRLLKANAGKTDNAAAAAALMHEAAGLAAGERIGERPPVATDEDPEYRGFA